MYKEEIYINFVVCVGVGCGRGRERWGKSPIKGDFSKKKIQKIKKLGVQFFDVFDGFDLRKSSVEKTQKSMKSEK